MQSVGTLVYELKTLTSPAGDTAEFYRTIPAVINNGDSLAHIMCPKNVLKRITNVPDLCSYVLGG